MDDGNKAAAATQAQAVPASSGAAVQRTPGKSTLIGGAFGGAVQLKGEGATDPAQVHAIADAGVSSSGGPLPHLDAIQRSFGSHDVSGVTAHQGAAAADASAALGAEAYAKGDQIAFGSTPDLHTAAHEAAHVVQQRAGVHLKGGVGEAGDPYERHADAVADKVVAGESAESLLSTMAGGGSSAGVQSKAVQLLGTALDKPQADGEPVPAHGEIDGEQRKFSPEQYIAMWEKEQGRKLTPEEKQTIDRGCIGITANNLNGGGNPLDSAEGTFSTFALAHAKMVEKNRTLDWMAKIPLLGEKLAGKARYVMFAKMFWSNQSDDPQKRKKPDENAFRPDKKGNIDMSGYKYHERPGFVNFDYAFWDEASQSFWHANHMDYGDPSDPMIVLQSTKEKFAAGYQDFDRVVYCIALAHNYDPGLAAIANVRKP